MIFPATPLPFFLLWAIQQAAGQPEDGDRSAILSASISTPGIARNMSVAQLSGGGDVNGSANTAHLMGQAGTAGTRVALPRQALKIGGGNYCGVV